MKAFGRPSRCEEDCDEDPVCDVKTLWPVMWGDNDSEFLFLCEPILDKLPRL